MYDQGDATEELQTFFLDPLENAFAGAYDEGWLQAMYKRQFFFHVPLKRLNGRGKKINSACRACGDLVAANREPAANDIENLAVGAPMTPAAMIRYQKLVGAVDAGIVKNRHDQAFSDLRALVSVGKETLGLKAGAIIPSARVVDPAKLIKWRGQTSYADFAKAVFPDRTTKFKSFVELIKKLEAGCERSSGEKGWWRVTDALALRLYQAAENQEKKTFVLGDYADELPSGASAGPDNGRGTLVLPSTEGNLVEFPDNEADADAKSASA